MDPVMEALTTGSSLGTLQTSNFAVTVTFELWGEDLEMCQYVQGCVDLGGVGIYTVTYADPNTYRYVDESWYPFVISGAQNVLPANPGTIPTAQ